MLRPVISIMASLLLISSFVTTDGIRAQSRYDVIIRNGRVFDGSGNPWFIADVAFQGDRIAAVGDLSNAQATSEIDATGFFVAPGFIDTHTHRR